MELDEMKTAWRELDSRLGRQETLSETFIRESIAARSQRSVNRFLNLEIVGAAVILAIIPVVVRRYGMPWIGDYFGMKAAMIFCMVLLPLIFVWQLVKIRSLFGIDMSKGVRDNIANARRYELCAMAEKRVGIVVSALMLAGLVMLWAAWGTPPWVWAMLGGAVTIAVLLCVWYYKKFFADNMRAIKRGLEELKELNEE